METSSSTLQAGVLGFFRYIAGCALMVVAMLALVLVFAGLVDVNRFGFGGYVDRMSAQLSAFPAWLSLVFVALSVLATLIVWSPAIALVRAVSAPRGWSDALLGLALGLLVASLARASGGRVALFAAAGLPSGLIYWLVVGRPRPPYPSSEPLA